MYIREIHIENIRGFRSGNRSVCLDLTRPDGSFAGWTVIVGRSGDDKSTLLQSTALSIAGPYASYALQDSFADWLTPGTTRGVTRTRLVPAEGDEFVDADKRTRDSFWSGMEWMPLAEISDAFASPMDPDLPSAGPWDDRAGGWFLAGYGPFRRLGGRAVPAQHLFEGPRRVARLVSLFHEETSPVEVLGWLKSLYLRRIGGDPAAKEAKEFEQSMLQLLDQGLLPRGMAIEKVHSDGLWVRRNGLRLPLRDLGRSASIVAALVLDLARQFCPNLGDFRLEKQGDQWVVPYEGVVLLDAFDAQLHGSWRQRAGLWLKAHFPRVQFIVTAHSPFACQAADPRGIIWVPTAAEDRPAQHVSDSVFKALVSGTAEEAAAAELFGIEYLEGSPWDEVRDNLKRSARGTRSSRGFGSRGDAAVRKPPSASGDGG
jgi:hypothetical protein